MWSGSGLEPASLLGFPLGSLVFVRLAAGRDGRPELGFEVFGEFVELGIAVDLDGLLGGVANYIAVVAPSQVLFQFGFCTGVNDAVQVIGDLVEKFRALHWLPSPPTGFCDPLARSRL